MHVQAVREERLQDVRFRGHVAVQYEEVLPAAGGRRGLEERVVQVARLGVVRLPGLADSEGVVGDCGVVMVGKRWRWRDG